MDITKDLPQLIVALDSTNEDANYIHIDDAKENAIYYCPCCKGIVKPRAYKKDIDYQVQSHFYHESGGCNEEIFVHYICKTWLFENGCKFIVNAIEYVVDSIKTETTLHTSFGDYRPDIIVETTVGKIFYFEIKVSNKKTDHYIPKWDELGNDVVEVDARYFINQKYKNNIPVFDLIYSDGECFIKSYTKNDYDTTIAKRKLEWKRQDKLNYKIQWEKLDWFWNKLVDYRTDDSKKDEVLNSFYKMDYKDRVWCYLNIKNKTCVTLKEEFKENINEAFEEEVKKKLSEYSFNHNFNLCIRHISALIYQIDIFINIAYKDYICRESSTIRTRTKMGIISCECFYEIDKSINKLLELHNKDASIIKEFIKLEQLPFVKEIRPRSHWASKKYDFSNLDFEIVFQDNIFSQYTIQDIGCIYINVGSINDINALNYRMHDEYKKYKKEALDELEDMFYTYGLKNNSAYNEVLKKLQLKCENVPDLDIRISSDFRRVWLVYNVYEICRYEFLRQDTFDSIGEKIYNIFSDKIEEVVHMENVIKKYVQKINNCKNGLWSCVPYYNNFRLKLTLCQEITTIVDVKNIYADDYENYVSSTLYESMKKLSNGEYYSIRLMEER